jgi:inorganic pyrophosphatase
MTRLHTLPSFANEKEQTLHAVVETARGSRNKFNYDETLDLFRLAGVLPAGASFPFDFGFIPSTLGEDGDPIDVLLLMDEEAFAGCLVETRLVGVIEAEQTEEEETVRNDRLIGVAVQSQLYRDVRTLDDLSDPLADAIVHFFTSYNDFKGKTFTPLGRYGPKRALALVESARQRFRRGRKKR